MRARSSGVRRDGSQCSQKLIVVGVGTNPEPHGDVSVDNDERSIAEPDSGGIDRLSCMNLLEAEAGVIRVALEAVIRFAGPAADMFGKAAVCVAETASRP
jgi:hypothetical protein